jgi:3-methyladenine DNA glycosylase AlkD
LQTPDSLVEQLTNLANPVQAEVMGRYLKTCRLVFLGLRHPEIRRLAVEHARLVPETHFLRFVEELWTHEVFEIRRAAIEALLVFVERGMPSEAAMAAISRMLQDLDTWALVDPLGWSVSKLLQRDSGVWSVLEHWARSGNAWTRRLSIVPLVDLCMKGQYTPECGPRILEALEPHLGDTEYFVAKAVGWALRELCKRDPDLVRTYIEEKGYRMSGLARREGSRKLWTRPGARDDGDG